MHQNFRAAFRASLESDASLSAPESMAPKPTDFPSGCEAALVTSLRTVRIAATISSGRTASLDVHADTIAVAVAELGGARSQSQWGGRLDSLSRGLRCGRKKSRRRGLTGYVLYRQLRALKITRAGTPMRGSKDS